MAITSEVRIPPVPLMVDIEEIKSVLMDGRSKRGSLVDDVDLLGTGSTLLNLAISGKTCGGFPAGKYVFFVGDSSSGKTFLALT